MVIVSDPHLTTTTLHPGFPRIEVYGDESLKRGGYDLLGGLWVRPEEARSLRSDIEAIRTNTKCPAASDELKWTRCSGLTVKPTYAAMVDLIMDRIRVGQAEFKCIVIDRRLVDNAAWNGGDKELGFFKAWHTLLFSKIEEGNGYRIRLDAMELRQRTRLVELRNVLNARGMRDKNFPYHCCESVEGSDSKGDDLIQVVDILTGAVGYHYSRVHLESGASPAKIELAARIARHVGRKTLDFSSKPWERKFNVWKWQPSRPKR